MDKIWYRNPTKSEVIGRCGGDEKNEWPRRTDKRRTLYVPSLNIIKPINEGPRRTRDQIISVKQLYVKIVMVF